LYTHEDGFEIMKDSDFLLQVDHWDEAVNYKFNLSDLTVLADDGK
jgi:hypothetical protein